MSDVHHGVELDQLQIWRDAETQYVIFQVPMGRIVMTPEQWDRAVAFLNTDCTCEKIGGDPLCPVHDLELIAQREGKAT